MAEKSSVAQQKVIARLQREKEARIGLRATQPTSQPPPSKTLFGPPIQVPRGNDPAHQAISNIYGQFDKAKGYVYSNQLFGAQIDEPMTPAPLPMHGYACQVPLSPDEGPFTCESSASGMSSQSDDAHYVLTPKAAEPAITQQPQQPPPQNQPHKYAQQGSNQSRAQDVRPEHRNNNHQQHPSQQSNQQQAQQQQQQRNQQQGQHQQQAQQHKQQNQPQHMQQQHKLNQQQQYQQQRQQYQQNQHRQNQQQQQSAQKQQYYNNQTSHTQASSTRPSSSSSSSGYHNSTSGETRTGNHELANAGFNRNRTNYKNNACTERLSSNVVSNNRLNVVNMGVADNIEDKGRSDVDVTRRVDRTSSGGFVDSGTRSSNTIATVHPTTKTPPSRGTPSPVKDSLCLKKPSSYNKSSNENKLELKIPNKMRQNSEDSVSDIIQKMQLPPLLPAIETPKKLTTASLFCLSPIKSCEESDDGRATRRGSDADDLKKFLNSGSPKHSNSHSKTREEGEGMDGESGSGGSYLHSDLALSSDSSDSSESDSDNEPDQKKKKRMLSEADEGNTDERVGHERKDSTSRVRRPGSVSSRSSDSDSSSNDSSSDDDESDEDVKHKDNNNMEDQKASTSWNLQKFIPKSKSDESAVSPSESSSSLSLEAPPPDLSTPGSVNQQTGSFDDGVDGDVEDEDDPIDKVFKQIISDSNAQQINLQNSHSNVIPPDHHASPSSLASSPHSSHHSSPRSSRHSSRNSSPHSSPRASPHSSHHSSRHASPHSSRHSSTSSSSHPSPHSSRHPSPHPSYPELSEADSDEEVPAESPHTSDSGLPLPLSPQVPLTRLSSSSSSSSEDSGVSRRAQATQPPKRTAPQNDEESDDDDDAISSSDDDANNDDKKVCDTVDIDTKSNVVFNKRNRSSSMCKSKQDFQSSNKPNNKKRSRDDVQYEGNSKKFKPDVVVDDKENIKSLYNQDKGGFDLIDGLPSVLVRLSLSNLTRIASKKDLCAKNDLAAKHNSKISKDSQSLDVAILQKDRLNNVDTLVPETKQKSKVDSNKNRHENVNSEDSHIKKNIPKSPACNGLNTFIPADSQKRNSSKLQKSPKIEEVKKLKASQESRRNSTSDKGEKSNHAPVNSTEPFQKGEKKADRKTEGSPVKNVKVNSEKKIPTSSANGKTVTKKNEAKGAARTQELKSEEDKESSSKRVEENHKQSLQHDQSMSDKTSHKKDLKTSASNVKSDTVKSSVNSSISKDKNCSKDNAKLSKTKISSKTDQLSNGSADKSNKLFVEPSSSSKNKTPTRDRSKTPTRQQNAGIRADTASSEGVRSEESSKNRSRTASVGNRASVSGGSNAASNKNKRKISESSSECDDKINVKKPKNSSSVNKDSTLSSKNESPTKGKSSSGRTSDLKKNASDKSADGQTAASLANTSSTPNVSTSVSTASNETPSSAKTTPNKKVLSAPKSGSTENKITAPSGSKSKSESISSPMPLDRRKNTAAGESAANKAPDAAEESNSDVVNGNISQTPASVKSSKPLYCCSLTSCVTGEDYQREAKRVKKIADAERDRYKRLVYALESSLAFLCNGEIMMGDRSDVNSANKMFKDCLKLHVYYFSKTSLEASGSQKDILQILSLRLQAIVLRSLYRLKRSETNKLQLALEQELKNPTVKTTPTPSNQSSNQSGGAGPVGGDIGSSPFSPHLPSPAGSVASVGSVGSGSGQNSSTHQQCVQMNKRTYSMMMSYFEYMTQLQQSTELWDQSDSIMDSNKDAAEFFKRLDSTHGRLDSGCRLLTIVPYYSEAIVQLHAHQTSSTAPSTSASQ